MFCFRFRSRGDQSAFLFGFLLNKNNSTRFVGRLAQELVTRSGSNSVGAISGFGLNKLILHILGWLALADSFSLLYSWAAVIWLQVLLACLWLAKTSLAKVLN